MGVRDVRLTGGEPLVRRDFPRLVEMLSAIEDVDEISVTTNGYLLERDAQKLVAAGVDRFNVSIDSLQRDRFFELTRRDALPQVLRGLEVLASYPEAHPIKVNAVAIRGFTEHEVIPFAEMARRTPYEIRFIEFMPLDGDRSWNRDRVLTGEEIRAAIDAVYPLEPLRRERHATARVYRFADGQGRIGFINPVSEPFCGDCNRIRLTADGRLRTCLFSLNETDLRGPMRAGADDRELELIIRRAVWRKELKHHVGEPGFIQPLPHHRRRSEVTRGHPSMVLLLLFALLAGAGTAITPCVLPVLPALLSASALGGRRRPLGIVLGLAVTFTIAIVALAQLVKGVGLASGAARTLAIVV